MRAPNEKMHIYYDLSAAPITFDAAVYFAFAIAKCRLAGFQRFDIHVVANTFRRATPRDKAYDDSIKNWRLNNIILRLPRLIPGVENIFLYTSNEINLLSPRFPEDYNPGISGTFPYLYPALLSIYRCGGNVKIYQATEFANSWARARIDEGKTVIIALRNADFDIERDTDLDVWSTVYHSLSAEGFKVLVIPDHMDCLFQKKYENYPWKTCAEAALDVDLRLALYTNAIATIGGVGGHTAPLWLSNSVFALFGILNNKSPVSSMAFLRRMGFSPHSQPPFFNSAQFLDWTDSKLLSAQYITTTALNLIRGEIRGDFI